MLALTVFLCASLVLLIPGACCWKLLFPEQGIFEDCVWGSIAGLGMAVYLAFVLSYWRLSLFGAIWVLLSVGAVAIVVRRAWLNRGAPQSVGVSKAALVILTMVAVSRFAPTILHQWPLGWDPSFHMILVKKVLLANGMVYDWRPFEDVPLNYPLGSHFLVAVISTFSNLPPHRVFQMLIPLIGILTTVEVYLLCLRTFLVEEAAVFAVVAYGFWAGYGSIDYYRWGGLPNALAMVFLLAILQLLMAPICTRKHGAMIAFFFTSICFTHHHVMVTGGIVMAALLVFSWLSGQKRKAVVLGSGLVGASALGSFYLLPYLFKATSLGSTDVLHFRENLVTITSLFDNVGMVLVCCGVLGIVLGWRARKNLPGAGLLLVVSGILSALYLFCGPIYRWLSLRFTGQDYVAFTPTRFLADLACVLSILAGYGAYRLRKYSRGSLTSAMLVGVALGVSNYLLWQELFREGGPQAGSERAYSWIAENTPADSIVLSTDPWACSVSWRRSLSSPLPISELRHSDRAQETLREDLRAGVLSNPAREHELLKVVPPGESAKGKVMWRDANGWSVIEVWPGQEASAAKNPGL